MLSRALSLATVTLLIGCFAGGAALAQVTNLEAGKSPSQIFAGTCNACHKSPRGLLKTVPASSLPGYLRQHYTTSSDMASVLASFLVSNGATDTRYQAKDQPKTDQAKGAKQEAAKPEGKPDQLDRFGRRQNPARLRRRLRPDADGITPQGDGPAATASGWHGRARRPMAPSRPMARRRCRPRPTARWAPSRSSAGAANPAPRSRRNPTRRRGKNPPSVRPPRSMPARARSKSPRPPSQPARLRPRPTSLEPANRQT